MNRRNIRWNDVTDLGITPDYLIAARLGVSQDCVNAARKARGIPKVKRFPTLAERMRANTDRKSTRGLAHHLQCHVWIGQRDRDGYGCVKKDGARAATQAHRVAWATVNGPIPLATMVCHRCDIPACVNPDHLFLGDALINNRDAIAKGRRGRFPKRKTA